MGGLVGGGNDNSELIAMQQAEMAQQKADLDKQKRKTEQERMDSLKNRLSGGSIFDFYNQKDTNSTLG